MSEHCILSTVVSPGPRHSGSQTRTWVPPTHRRPSRPGTAQSYLSVRLQKSLVSPSSVLPPSPVTLGEGVCRSPAVGGGRGLDVSIVESGVEVGLVGRGTEGRSQRSRRFVPIAVKGEPHPLSRGLTVLPSATTLGVRSACPVCPRTGRESPDLRCRASHDMFTVLIELLQDKRVLDRCDRGGGVASSA